VTTLLERPEGGPDPRHFPQLLSTNMYRPHRRADDKKDYKVAPPHVAFGLLHSKHRIA
jgi:hypothetical protein